VKAEMVLKDVGAGENGAKAQVDLEYPLHIQELDYGEGV
jgi:hypothetical protein